MVFCILHNKLHIIQNFMINEFKNNNNIFLRNTLFYILKYVYIFYNLKKIHILILDLLLQNNEDIKH